MAFVLGKLVWLVLRPSSLLLLLALLGLFGCRLGRAWGVRLLAASLLALAACALLPVGQWLTVPLENRFPRPGGLPGHVDGVVFLGGGIDGAVTRARGLPSFGDTMERFAAIPELARRLPDARLIFTGGTAWNDRGADDPEAATIARFLADQGLPEGRVTLEDRARSTRENALFTLTLARPAPGQRWLLVTSARHMPRAMGVFRRAGWPGLEAWPVDYRTTGSLRLLAEPLASERLRELDEAVYEWYGLLYYRLLGYTDTLFPAPEGDPLPPSGA
ncbi:YdcF family protein [Benzoatithermus flavus]|uniref:YdcF family protein n=1 Tax=Benzoatithermus flavus TaxID=3108223 RepID=A0ABU8XT23_9PROT